MLARRLVASWGEKMRLRYREVTAGKALEMVAEQYEKLKGTYEFRLAGEVHLMESSELFVYLLPTGDLYLSTAALQGLTPAETRWFLAHQLAHMHLRHPQELLTYSHISAIVTAWLHRENHHTTQSLGDYLIEARNWTGMQEREADAFALETCGEIASKPLCFRGIEAAAEQKYDSGKI